MLISNTYGILCLVVLLAMGLFNLPIAFITAYRTEHKMDILLENTDELFKKYRGLQMELKVALLDFNKLLNKVKTESEYYIYIEFMK